MNFTLTKQHDFAMLEHSFALRSPITSPHLDWTTTALPMGFPLHNVRKSDVWLSISFQRHFSLSSTNAAHEAQKTCVDGGPSSSTVAVDLRSRFPAPVISSLTLEERFNNCLLVAEECIQPEVIQLYLGYWCSALCVRSVAP